MLCGKFVRGFQYEGAFHGVFELAHIAGPVVAFEFFQSFIGFEGAGRPAFVELSLWLMDEMAVFRKT
jgi:hypothetical protein